MAVRGHQGEPAARGGLLHAPDRRVEYGASGIDVLRIDDGLLAQIDAFVLPHLFAAGGQATRTAIPG
jgi:hypothetical protein